MSAYIKKDRLKSAIIRLADWRGQVQSQTSAHLFPFLALVRKGVQYDNFTRYEESDDFDFFDSYFRAGDKPSEPYFDPLTRKFRIASHPHSNVATARKGTFEKSWQAATSKVQNGESYWKLNKDAIDRIISRVMTRGRKTSRVNLLDLAVWLFRNHPFEDGSDSDTVLAHFRATFPMRDGDFDRLFEYSTEPPSQLFTDHPLTASDVAEVVDSLALLDDKPLFSTPITKSIERPRSQLADDDPILSEVHALIDFCSSGIILRGAPGTSKSWYAWNIALAITNNNPDHIYRVQFHPSFGYDDFVEGYLPDENNKSGFKVDDRVFIKAVKAAKGMEDPVVFIIDEINRGDTSRIFGELLTYIEHGWRDVTFTSKLSGAEISIPRNLIVIATMNPHDRSITQLDMALLRRFDHIDIHPSKERVSQFLLDSGMGVQEIDFILQWFDQLQSLLPFGIGHAYFLNVGDIGKLGLVWRYRVLPFCESILEFEQERLDDIKRSYAALERRLRGQQIA